jgi:2-keto-4-pentenoate hydratase/2-oxohepta-3-ene-1,7-dioic acid hydratase in catechol pathway
MNGFHPAIQDLGKLSDLSYLTQGSDSGLFENPVSSTGRKHLDAESGESTGKIHDSTLVCDADQRALYVRHELPILTCDCADECGMLELMRLVTFQRAGAAPQAGILTPGGRITGLGIDMLAVIATGQPFSVAGASYDLGDVKLLAPIPRPPKFICVGLNYRDHARETGMEIPTVPTIFNKFTNVVIGPGAPIVLPKVSTRPDYEAEFAFVIGTGGRRISASDALNHVFGYTIVNDVTARDYQMVTSQWLMGKTFDTFAPMGPWIVTRDEIADPHALDVSLEIGGEILQHSNTRELVFGVPALIEYISSVVTLEPGDVVATGTPAGVGFARKPPRYLRASDEVVIRIQGIGELRNPVVAES